MPPLKDIPQSEANDKANDEVDIHILDFARAFNGDFASNGGVAEYSNIGTDIENN